jgi:glycosyltransferase involved in cell wall biosynthesis
VRIGLNATCFDDRPSGANQRFRQLYGAVIRRNPEIEFLIYESADGPVASWFADLPNVVARRTPLPGRGRLRRAIAGLGYWKRALRRDALDLFETFSLPLVEAPDCPTLFTIHDLRPVHRSTGTTLDRFVARRVLRHAFDHADHIVAVSEAVRTEILAWRPRAAVSVVYNGIDPAPFGAPQADAIATIRRRYALPDAFALCVGHIEPRKNLSLLIDAVAALQDAGCERPLVIAGRDGGARAAIIARIAHHNVGHRVTLIDDADDEALRSLYAASRLVVMASRDEGFGIPLLEAMAAGRPLVLSDIAVFRELMQDHGCYFRADDAHSAADAIERVWTDRALRARLVAYGRGRVRDFDFDRLADRISALYVALCAPSGTSSIRAIRSRAATKEWKRS